MARVASLVLSRDEQRWQQPLPSMPGTPVELLAPVQLCIGVSGRGRQHHGQQNQDRGKR